jgi:glyoxylase-like metal-dependent hydrolase (beta-lactamase superfamily II)
MQLWSLEGNTQKLDGGAMFGNCPKSVWTRWCTPDDENRIDLACRALLVRDDTERLILFEAGVGAFFEPSLRERYGIVEEEHMLLRSLNRIGLGPDDIDVIVLSHLHFDHAGGVLSRWCEGEPLQLAFPGCRFVVGEEAWLRARSPHPRDRASFIPELPDLLEATGRLERVTDEVSGVLGSGYRFSFSGGHTPGLMLTRIEATDPGPITFVGDLIPGVPWIHAPITMGYDRNPERLIDEKSTLLDGIAEAGEWIFMPHDPRVAACRVRKDEQGRFSAADERVALEAGGQQLA